MSELTFIGLANYTLGTTNYCNIIFTANNDSMTSYSYQFSTTSTPSGDSAWIPIVTLSNVIISAGTEINVQLIIPNMDYINSNYFVFIYSSTTDTCIWQQSNLTNLKPLTTATYLYSNKYDYTKFS